MKLLITSVLTVFLVYSVNAQIDKNSSLEGLEIFKVVEEMPLFPGCDDLPNKTERTDCSRKKLLEYVRDNLVYPYEAVQGEIEGKEYVQFVVSPEGKVLEPEVVRSILGPCHDASLDLVNSFNDMPEKWTPGKQRGIPKHVLYTMPISYDLETVAHQETATGEILNIFSNEVEVEKVDTEPLFPGFEHIEDYEKRRMQSHTACLQYIYKNLRYPELAKKNGVDGRVLIQFIVTKEGQIKDATIKKDIGSGCGEAALEVIESMNDMDKPWNPATANGKAVDRLFTMPVVFRLNKSANHR